MFKFVHMISDMVKPSAGIRVLPIDSFMSIYCHLKPPASINHLGILGDMGEAEHGVLPSDKLTVCELENGPVEIVDIPIKNGGSFHSCLYVYQARYLQKCHFQLREVFFFKNVTFTLEKSGRFPKTLTVDQITVPSIFPCPWDPCGWYIC